MGINIKPQTWEIYTDIKRPNGDIEPIMVAIFREEEKSKAEAFLVELKAHALYPVRLVVKGI